MSANLVWDAVPFCFGLVLCSVMVPQSLRVLGLIMLALGMTGVALALTGLAVIAP